MIKIAILRPQALRALPRITNTEITLAIASSTSLGSGSAQLFAPGSWVLHNNKLHNTGGHSYEAEVRLLDDRDNSLDILLLAYMDHTMGMVIILPRVKTNPL